MENKTINLVDAIPAMRGALSKMLHRYGQYSDDTLNEMCQRALLNALESSVPAYNGSGDFTGWIVFCAKNYTRKQLALHHNSKPHDSINSTGYRSDDGASVDGVVVEGTGNDSGAAPAKRSAGATLNTSHVDAVAAIDRAIEMNRLLDVLATLSGARRIAARMIASGRHSGVEIATESGLSTVKVSRLRKWLASQVQA